MAKRKARANTYRVRREDLKQAIFKPDERKVAVGVEEEEKDVEVFTILGKQDDFDDDEYPILFDTVKDLAEDRPDACAKRVSGERGFTYFIKRAHDGKFLNPIGLYEENRHSARRLGQDLFNFKQVPKKAFEFYVKFLKTKNRAWLQNAEREVF